MLLTAAANGGVNIGILIVYIVGFGALMYFMSYRPQKKEQERNPLKRIDDSFKKIIIVKDNIVPRYDEYGIYYIGIRDFLLMDDFLEA